MAKVLFNKYRPSLNPSAVMNNADEIDGYLLHSQTVNQQSIDESEQVPFSRMSSDDARNAIGNLPDDFRLIVVLSLLEGFSYQEVADIACIDLETVRSRLRRGRKLMQRELFDKVACEGNYNVTADRVRSRRTG